VKTRQQILEIIHDSVLEDKIRMEVAIRNLDDRKDNEVIDATVKQTPFGVREQEITKKDLVKDYEAQIAKREHALKTIEKIINEEDEKGNHTTKEQKKKRSGVE